MYVLVYVCGVIDRHTHRYTRMYKYMYANERVYINKSVYISTVN